MRARTIFLATGLGAIIAGCLSAPTGLTPSDAGAGSPDARSADAAMPAAMLWPTTGLDVVAIVATAFVGSDDVLVLSSGSGATAGLYWIAGSDIDVTAATAITKYRAFRQLDIQAPTALAVVELAGVPTVVVASANGTDVQLRTFSGMNLAAGSSIADALTVTPGDPAWMQTIAFPGNKPHLVIGQGSNVAHVDLGSAFTTQPLMAGSAPGSDDTFLSASSFVGSDGSSYFYALSSGSNVYVGTLPMGGAPGAVSLSSAWDSSPVIGLTIQPTTSRFAAVSPSSQVLCEVDPSATSSSACTQLATAGGSDNVSIVFGSLIGPANSATSAIAVVGGSALTTMWPFQTIVYAGSPGSESLNAGSAIPHATLSIAQARAAQYANGALVMGSDGTNTCATFGSAPIAGGYVQCSSD